MTQAKNKFLFFLITMRHSFLPPSLGSEPFLQSFLLAALAIVVVSE